MTRYAATITHHSIASARTVEVGNDLAAAKRRAYTEFGGEQRDYMILIIDTKIADPYQATVATRRVGADRWETAQ